MFDEVIESLKRQGMEPSNALAIAGSEHSINMILHISTKSPNLPGRFIHWDNAEIQALTESLRDLLSYLIEGLVELNSASWDVKSS